MAYAIHNKKKLYVLFENQSYLDYFPNIRSCPYVRFFFDKDANGLTNLYKATMWISDNPKKNLGAKFERALLKMADKQRFNVEGELRDWCGVGGAWMDGNIDLIVHTLKRKRTIL